jgi:hypothetical protein
MKRAFRLERRPLNPKWQDVTLTQSDGGETGRRLTDLGGEQLAAMDETGLDVQDALAHGAGRASLDPDDATASRAHRTICSQRPCGQTPSATKVSLPPRPPTRRQRRGNCGAQSSSGSTARCCSPYAGAQSHRFCVPASDCTPGASQSPINGKCFRVRVDRSIAHSAKAQCA